VLVGDFEGSYRGFLPSLIVVKQEIHIVGISFECFYMVSSDCRPRSCDRDRISELMQSNDIHLSFYDYDVAIFFEMFFDDINAIQGF